MQDGCKVFSLRGVLHGIEWVMFHGHLDHFQKSSHEVGLTSNGETMALRMFTIVDLVYLIICEDLHE